ncbi:MAG: primosomal protein N' [Armatimonadetes bacterium]|nr:primosomal protein N' [Armatimonadota bacterium]
MKFAEIIVENYIKAPDKTFIYHIPENLEDKVKLGTVVLVPFRNLNVLGYVVGFSEKVDFETKEIIKLIPQNSDYLPELINLIQYLSKYYGVNLRDAFNCVLPGAIRDFFKKKKESLNKEIKKEIYPATFNLKLNHHQEEALKLITQTFFSDKKEVFLLHGVTGSGKTEVYLQILDLCLKENKEAIVLVPEIALTPQAVERYKGRFGDIAVLHSRMSDNMRALEWQRINQKKVHIALGTRSAVFAPFANLGLIIIDEEQDGSYKQENFLRYHARTVAIKRAHYHNALVVLGSATPSIESYYSTMQKKYHYYFLPHRIDNYPLAEVEIVSLSCEEKTIFSEKLLKEIENTLNQNKQVILFLNRRGYHNYILCRSCGYVFRCLRCNISLTYHADLRKLCCHYCFYQKNLPDLCPKCGGFKFKYGGFGIQKAEEELKKYFSKVKILRMDRDTTVKKGSHNEILSQFAKGEAKILIGTQMIAKGLDFPYIGLVGVILADTILNLPDFRAQERTFQLLAQVAGRAGRRTAGKVIIQTYVPEHSCIINASLQDYQKFYHEEIKIREETNFPPFAQLVNFILSSKDCELVKQESENLINFLKENLKEFKFSGPAPCIFGKINNFYRWHFILRSNNLKNDMEIFKNCLDKYKFHKEIKFHLDVDPYSLL